MLFVGRGFFRLFFVIYLNIYLNLKIQLLAFAMFLSLQ